MVMIEPVKRKEPEDKRPLTVINSVSFMDDFDGEPIDMNSGELSDSIDVAEESYIMVYTGRRGGGKTTTMSYAAAKCMALYHMRCLSNYPIEFMLCQNVHGQDTFRRCASEDLDLYKLLCFDKDYKNCLVVMDEAPDIISHMSSSTWKNRLLNIFTRQLRKNGNSLIMGAQDLMLIDKSMRWQVDIEVQAQDARKAMRNPDLTRGSVILLRWLDHSGVWTGQTTQDRLNYNKMYHMGGDDPMAADHTELHAHGLWGDKEHKPVFDTYFQQDVWESLMRVDMKLGSYHVGQDPNQKPDEGGETLNDKARNFIGMLIDDSKEMMPTKEVTQAMESLGDTKFVRSVRVALNKAGVGHHQDTRTKREYYVFTGIDDVTGEEVNFDFGVFGRTLEKEK